MNRFIEHIALLNKRTRHFFARNMAGRIVRSMALVFLLTTHGLVQAATGPEPRLGDWISGQAQLNYRGSDPVIATNDVLALRRNVTDSAAEMQFLRFLHASELNVSDASTLGQSRAGNAVHHLNNTYCQVGGDWQVSPAPQSLMGEAIDLDRPHAFQATDHYALEEPFFIWIKDPDQNSNNFLLDQVEITVSFPETGASVHIAATETGPDTGEFVGFVNPVFDRSPGHVCAMPETGNSALVARYLDGEGQERVLEAGARVAPISRVINSDTGDAIDGAKIRLQQKVDGEWQDADVKGVARSRYPAEVISGQAVDDDQQKNYPVVSGAFYYPVLMPGEYRLQVEPPRGYQFPSSKTDSELQKITPVSIASGSKGESFSVPFTGSFFFDLPVDPVASHLFVDKVAAKAQVDIGDFVAYTIQIENRETDAVADVVINDTLPQGFRLQGEAVVIETGERLAPIIGANPRSLTFQLSNLAGQSRVSIRYMTQATAATPLGEAINVVTVTGERAEAVAEARAKVLVKEALMRSRAILTGRVIAGECGGDKRLWQGVAKARIVLEDGTYVDTDSDGNWHIDDVRPGTHVVQLDTESLAEGYRLHPCEQGQLAKFVDVQGGTLWRTDFFVTGPKVDKSDSSEKAKEEKSATTQSETAAEGFVNIADGDVLASAIQTISFRLPTALKPRLTLDGKLVPEANLGFSLIDEAATSQLYSYVGIDLGQIGSHRLLLEGLGPFGNVRFSQSIAVRLSGEPALIKAMPLPQHENLADGKTPLGYKFQLFDAEGNAIPANFELQLQAQRLQAHQEEFEQRRLLARDTKKLSVNSRGEAYFAPVNESGLYRGEVRYKNLSQRFEVLVAPAKREWILVGLAEASAWHREIESRSEAIEDSKADKDIYQQGRLAFYAKGQIKGEWLLTIAYDSARKRDRELFSQVDPNQYYTLYGDASQRQFDAASQRKLYLRIERAAFYALFGDMETGLTVTELGSYNRRFNGFKSAYEGKHFSVNVFAADTSQRYRRDELRGDGTSGIYRLSQGDIAINSDRIRLLVRDRLRSETIVSERNLSRFNDYQIDYTTGELIFKAPVFSQDASGNPQFIIAEYEVDGDIEQDIVAGGRVAVRPIDSVELGTTFVENGDERLQAVDARVQVSENGELRVESATVEGSSLLAPGDKAEAKMAEFEYKSANLDTSVYYRRQEKGFSQQSVLEDDKEKFGTRGVYHFDQNHALAVDAFTQRSILDAREIDNIDVKWQYRNQNDQWNFGLRSSASEFNSESLSSESLLFGGRTRTLDGRLALLFDAEYALVDDDEDSVFPTRFQLGAEYELTSHLDLLTQQIYTFNQSANTQSHLLGLRARPWTGGQVSAHLANEQSESRDRLFSVLGLNQLYRLDKHWSVGFGVDQSALIKETVLDTEREGFADPSAGNRTEDFRAAYLALGYLSDHWEWVNRLERRQADSGNRWNWFNSVIYRLSDGVALASGADWFQQDRAGNSETRTNIQFGLAYRPLLSSWMAFNKLEWKNDKQVESGRDGWRIVNNLNAFYQANDWHHWAFQYGLKYQKEQFIGESFDDTLHLLGMEYRYQMMREWDLGWRHSVLHGERSSVTDYSMGPSLGYRPSQDMWISLGFNLSGFQEADFTDAEYQDEGWYLKFRLKFDQRDFLNFWASDKHRVPAYQQNND